MNVSWLHLSTIFLQVKIRDYNSSISRNSWLQAIWLLPMTQATSMVVHQKHSWLRPSVTQGERRRCCCGSSELPLSRSSTVPWVSIKWWLELKPFPSKWVRLLSQYWWLHRLARLAWVDGCVLRRGRWSRVMIPWAVPNKASSAKGGKGAWASSVLVSPAA